MSLKKAVVAGHICLDVIPDLAALPEGHFEQFFRPGQLISVGEAAFFSGGPVSNVGLALHRLGIPTQLLAKIGDDPFGRAISRIIQGIDPHLLGGIRTDPEAPTSYSIIASFPGVDRIFLHCPGVNDEFRSGDIDWELLQQVDLLHFGYPPIMQQMYRNQGEELAAVFSGAKETGVTTSLDMAFPDPASEGARADWSTILQKTLPFVDIFAPSLEETLFLLHRDEYENMLTAGDDLLDSLTPDLLTSLSSELLAMGAKIVLLKIGHQGLYLRTASADPLTQMGRGGVSDPVRWAKQELWAPCFAVDAVGTTGAGDATIAGFLSALLRGLPPQQAITAAVGVGACNVEGADALSGLRSWEATLARIARGWTQCPLKIDHPRWHWDDDYRIWQAA
jgi:sugar/nucleoside kinase (ribokinase family)